MVTFQIKYKVYKFNLKVHIVHKYGIYMESHVYLTWYIDFKYNI